ncbi:MAG: hypothetical protein AB3N64_06995 [Puniceicoccaceae bacterium]
MPADVPESLSKPDVLAEEKPVEDGPPADRSTSQLQLQEALQKIPESLQKEMKELLKAEFNQVQRWKPEDS